MLGAKHAYVCLVMFLVPTSLAVRKKKSRLMSAATDLRVFATTFNAGNENYDGSGKFHELANTLVDGHENEGLEADIVFLGFQEFQDNKYVLGHMIRQSLLWQRTASDAMKAFKGAVENATKVPSDVSSSEQALAKTLDEFQKTISLELSKLSSNGSLQERLAPLVSWSREVSETIDTLWQSNLKEYPSLTYSAQGSEEWKKYKRTVFNANHLDNFFRQGAEPISNFLKTWSRKKENLLHGLHQPTKLAVGAQHVEVKMYPQKWNSGQLCGAAGHYDTFMYAYVNPFSKWKITPVEFNSSVCKSRNSMFASQLNPGCTIDNGGQKVGQIECGKVVNLMVLKAEREGTTLKICGLNTHMSFAGTAAERMSYIEKAIEQTSVARCDAVFFVGDFNSRAHCEESSTQGLKGPRLPLFERRGKSGSSLDYVLDTFCTDEQGNLTCELNYADELKQILDKDILECYEETEDEGTRGSSRNWIKGTSQQKKEKKVIWDIVARENPVKHMGLREVTPPRWPPTYKLMTQKDKIKEEKSGSRKKGAWKRCYKNEPLCFMNPSEKGKHNPAWTDRILMKSSRSTVHLEPSEYSRRPVPSISSDHSAVTAMVKVKVEERSSFEV